MLSPRISRGSLVKRFGTIAFGLLAVLAGQPVMSASIEVRADTDNDFRFIFVEGDFEYGDEKNFIKQVLDVQDGVVVFGSNGGNLFAARKIGEAIRLKGLKTLVPDDVRCASACAIAWLAGTPRFMGLRARVGFHAAYRTEGDRPEVSPPGNALVGAYLNRLGLPDRAVSYITSAPPQGMTWLSFSDAEKVGIEVKPFELALNESSSPPQSKTQDPPPTPPAPTIAGSRKMEMPTVENSQPRGPKVAIIVPPIAAPQSEVRAPQPPQLEPQRLDLADLDAASQVQRRLQERGYFVGLVDGVWGPKSRIALRDFKATNGLGADDGWNLRVQFALFDDGYRAAPAAYVPPDPATTTNGLFQPFPPPPDVRLHPLNRADALRIQSQLLELGYYRKAGDGVWGLASRSALRDFKAANGLPADDIWDSSVEALIQNGRSLHAAETPFGEWAIVGTSCIDPNSLQRLTISAKDISARQMICRLQYGLVRSGDKWFGSASCLRDQQEISVRVSLEMAQGRLVDHSTGASTPSPEPRPPVFERCR